MQRVYSLIPQRQQCYHCLGSGMVRVLSKRRPDDPPPRMLFGELREVEAVSVRVPCAVCKGTGLSEAERKKQKPLRQGIVERWVRKDDPDESNPDA